MTFNIEAVKRHKTAILVGVGVLVAYILYRVYVASQGASGAGLADANGETPTQQQIDLINAQAGAQASVIAASYQGQVQVAQVGAGTYTQYLQTQEDLTNIQTKAKVDVAQSEIGVYTDQLANQLQLQQFSEGLTSTALAKWRAPTSNDIALLISALLGKGPQQSQAFAQVNAASAGSSPASIIGALNPAGLFGAYEAAH